MIAPINTSIAVEQVAAADDVLAPSNPGPVKHGHQW